MGQFSATEAAFAGFRFVRSHPQVIAVWGGILVLIAAVFGLAIVTTVGPTLMQIQALGPRPDPSVSLPLLQKLLPFYGVMFLFMLVFYPTLYAAMSRALLRPEDDAFAYLRFGGDEIRQFLLFLLMMLVMAGLYIALIIGVVIVAVVAGMVAGKGLAAGALAGLAMIPGLCGFVFVVVRLSLASPLTFDRGRVDLFGSWRLTRGRFWSLFGCYLMMFFLALVIFLLVLIIYMAVAAAIGGIGSLGLLFKPDMSNLANYYTPARLVLTVLGGFFGAAFWPVWLMPPVDAYRQLRTGDEPVTSA